MGFFASRLCPLLGRERTREYRVVGVVDVVGVVGISPFFFVGMKAENAKTQLTF
jgi:hypothetical protein